MNTDSVKDLTPCPRCGANDEYGRLVKHTGRSWICENCTHVFDTLNEVLRGVNANRKAERARRFALKKKNADNQKKGNAADTGGASTTTPREQPSLPGLDLRCYRCDQERLPENHQLKRRSDGKIVNWAFIGEYLFCPDCLGTRWMECKVIAAAHGTKN